MFEMRFLLVMAYWVCVVGAYLVKKTKTTIGCCDSLSTGDILGERPLWTLLDFVQS